MPHREKPTANVAEFVVEVRELHSLLEDDIMIREGSLPVTEDKLAEVRGECVNLLVRAAHMRRRRARFDISDQAKASSFAKTTAQLDDADASLKHLLENLDSIQKARRSRAGVPSA